MRRLSRFLRLLFTIDESIKLFCQLFSATHIPGLYFVSAPHCRVVLDASIGFDEVEAIFSSFLLFFCRGSVQVIEKLSKKRVDGIERQRHCRRCIFGC